MKKIALVGSILVAFASANAIIFESEPNNSIATADVITRGAAPWADVGVMDLTAGGGDMDFFSLSLTTGEILTIITTPQEIPFEDPDTVLGLFDTGGVLLAVDDDFGSGLGSAIQWVAEYSGNHFIAVTGFPDFDFVGDHGQDGSYILTVSIVPEPASMLALATGLAALAARRRRK